MLSFLKNHPFAIETFFESSLALTYAIPKEELKGMIPECLALDTYEDKWAFIEVAMVKAQKLRPMGFPEFAGNNANLICCRILVRYITRQGKRLRGIYVISSETDKRRILLGGKLFTHYSYKVTDIRIKTEAAVHSVKSVTSGLDVAVNINNERPTLPPKSPFAEWKDAKQYAGPLPYVFTYHQKTNEVLIVEGLKELCEPVPVQVFRSNVSFVNALPLKGLVLASAFIVRNIPYHWEKGRLEKWK